MNNSSLNRESLLNLSSNWTSTRPGKREAVPKCSAFWAKLVVLLLVFNSSSVLLEATSRTNYCSWVLPVLCSSDRRTRKILRRKSCQPNLRARIMKVEWLLPPVIKLRPSLSKSTCLNMKSFWTQWPDRYCVASLTIKLSKSSHSREDSRCLTRLKKSSPKSSTSTRFLRRSEIPTPWSATSHKLKT